MWFETWWNCLENTQNKINSSAEYNSCVPENVRLETSSRKQEKMSFVTSEAKIATVELSTEMLLDSFSNANNSQDITNSLLDSTSKINYFLKLVDYYIQNNDYEILRKFFTKWNWNSFELNFPSPIRLLLLEKISPEILFWDLEEIILNWETYKNIDDEFYDLWWKKLDFKDFYKTEVTVEEDTKEDTSLPPEFEVFLESEDFQNYCEYFSISQEEWRADLEKAHEIIEKLSPNIQELVIKNLVLFLWILKDSWRLWVNMDYTYTVSLTIIESHFWTDTWNWPYKWPFQVWKSVIDSIKKRTYLYNPDSIKALEESLWKSVKKLTLRDCDNFLVCSTIGHIYLELMEKESWKFDSKKSSLMAYFEPVYNKLSTKDIKIDKKTFEKVVDDIMKDPEKKKTFLALINYNGSTAKNIYALAIMCTREVLFWENN